MKKRYRIITSLILVTLLVTALAAPVLAHSGSDYMGSIYYNWTVTREERTGTATVGTPYQPASVKAKVENHMRYELTGDTHMKTSTQSGFAGTSASTDSLMYINEVPVYATMTKTYGTFWVSGTQVVTNALD